MGKHSEERGRRRPPRKDENETEKQDIYSSREMEKKAGRKRRKPALRVAAIIISVLLVLIIGVGVGGFLYFDNILKDLGGNGLDEDKIGVDSSNSENYIKNIALFGIDSRSNQSVSQDEDGKKLKGLSDTIMVMSVNTKTKQIKLISIMRDSAVKVDGTYRKINAAYSRGGAELALNTLNTNFGLDITDYATVNFAGMAEIIDVVGGVEVEVTQGEIDDKKYGVNAQILEQAKIVGITPEFVKTPGKQVLDGNQAVAWARIRKQPTATGERDDYGRTARQRQVLNQLFEKAKKLNVLEYPNLIEATKTCVETSLSSGEILTLAKTVILGGTLSDGRIPYDGYTQPGKLVRGGVHYDLDIAKDMIKQFIYDDKTFAEYDAELKAANGEGSSAK